MVWDPQAEYLAGLVGCESTPESRGEFASWVQSQGFSPSGDENIVTYGLLGSGAGKLTAHWTLVEKVFQGCWPASAQSIGDCFPAGTMVSMADGTKKPIEDVTVGEVVLSHVGTPRRVTDTIRKPFSGSLVKIRAKGSPLSVSATPDHQFITVNGGSYWCPVELLNVGDLVSLPRHDATGEDLVFDLAECPNAVVSGGEGRHLPCSSVDRIRWHGSRKEVPRYVRMDERLAWLVGLYLAEGSCDMGPRGPNRITFNLNKNETLLAETAATYIKDIFGIDSQVCQVPSKPSVLYVRVTCGPFAWLLKQLAPGNTYTKRLNRIFMRQPKAVRLAALRGWFAGDGSLNAKTRSDRKGSRWSHFRAVGVSVSASLVEDMFDLANSCGLVASVSFRKPRNASKAASNLLLSGAHAAAVFPSRLKECRVDLTRSKKASRHGILKPIASVERVPFSGEVFCLEVEHDHSFIANGYAVHNCVSHSQRNACLYTIACEIAAGKPDEVTGLVEQAPEQPDEGRRDGAFSTEAYYWFRRRASRDGWFCEAAAKVAIEEAGAFPRKNYPELGVDLTKYSGSNATRWGATPPPEAIRAQGKKHLFRTAATCESFEAVRDMLANGYGVTSCGSEGFSSTRDENGVSRRSGSWAHALAYIGCDDRDEIKAKYAGPLVLVMNSWGKWNGGPRRVYGTTLDIPEGSFWARWSDISGRVAIAMSGFNGWPAQKLPDWTTGIF